MTTARAAGRWLAALCLAVLFALTPTTPAQAASCSGVWVVVGSDVRCAADHSSGLAALRSAGYDVQTVGSGFVCRIDGSPETCTMATPYWSYWHAFRNADGSWGAWQYSTKGATAYDPPAGSADGWSYGDGKTPPPALPPAAPATSTTTKTTTTTTTSRPATSSTRPATGTTTSRPATSGPAPAPTVPGTAPAPTVVPGSPVAPPSVTGEPTGAAPSADAASPAPESASVPSAATGSDAPAAVAPTATGTPTGGSPVATIATAAVAVAAVAGLGAWAVVGRRPR